MKGRKEEWNEGEKNLNERKKQLNLKRKKGRGEWSKWERKEERK